MTNKFFPLSLGGVAVVGTGTGLGVYYGIGNKNDKKPTQNEVSTRSSGSSTSSSVQQLNLRFFVFK